MRLPACATGKIMTDSWKTAALLTGAMVAVATSAHAQTQLNGAATAGGDEPAVVVTGKRPHAPADRDVYDVGKDPDAAGKTAADALNTIPGVFVDGSGNVTLHGRAVEILVDGHPSLLLNGDNRGAALRAMPSSYISSIEIISTPGAQFSAQGSGGIINIVTSHGMPEGGFGSVGAQIKSRGGYGVTLDGNVHAGKLSAMGSVNYTRDIGLTTSRLILAARDTAGATRLTTRNDGASRSANGWLDASGNVEYELTADDTLHGQANLFDTRSRFATTTRSATSDAGDRPTETYSGINSNIMTTGSQSLGFGWLHYGRKADEKLKVDGSLSRSLSRMSGTSLDTYALSAIAANSGMRVSRFLNTSDIRNAMLGLDYDMPVGDDQLSLGAQVTRDDSVTDSQTFGPDDLDLPATRNALLSSRFRYRQTVSAAYVTWQRELSDRLTVLGGLRVEALDLSTRLVTSGVAGHVADTTLNPSFFATYVLSPNARLRFSYSHRLQRPAPQDVNPYRTLVDSQHVLAGNPRLRPQDTDSYELTYDTSKEAMSFTARGFYQIDSHRITPSSLFIPDPQQAGNQVLETTSINSGSGETGGVELTFSNQLTKALHLMSNLTVQATHLRGGGASAQSTRGLSGGASISYTLTPKDFFTLSYNATGKQLTGQGYTLPYAYDMMMYNHILTPKLTFMASVTNALRMAKTTQVIDTPAIHSRSFFTADAPTVMIMLSRSFGGFKAPKPENPKP